MASIVKVKGARGVRFQYSLQVNGKQERKTFETKAECEAALDARRVEVREGRITGLVPISVQGMAEKYLAHKTLKGKRSISKDRERLTAHLVPFFGPDTLLSTITARGIAEYQHRRASTLHPRLKRPVTGSTINRDVSILRCLLRMAETWGHIRKAPKIELAKEPEGRLRYLDQAEAARLLAACAQSHNTYLATIVTVALHTGMRKGEILGLTWARVDFSRGALLLTQTKNGKRREVPMNRAVDDVLSTLATAERQGGKEPEGLVFHKVNGAEWGRLDTAFRVALKRASITDFRFHDLRHTFASWLVMDGATLLEVKELLGHTTLAMTLRYAHLAPGRLRDAVGRLDRIGLGGPVAEDASKTAAESALTAHGNGGGQEGMRGV